MDIEIERFIIAVEKGFRTINPKTAWPLNGAQMDAYFDVDDALDIYFIVKELREKLSFNEIVDLMPAPDIIRYFLTQNGIIGLKVSNKLNICFISIEDRVDFILFMFKVLKAKVRNDIFCSDGKNLLLSLDEVDKLSDNVPERVVSDSEKRCIGSLIVTANNLCYTLYYDEYQVNGFYIHGPYDVSENFGKGAVLVVRDYHDICPKKIWSNLSIKYKCLKVVCVYKNLNFELNFFNQPITTTSIADKLIGYQIYLDGKEIDLSEVSSLIEHFRDVSYEQTKLINSLSDLDKVRKGAEINFYFFKKLREHVNSDCKPPKTVEDTIQKLGNQFIEKFKYDKLPSLEHWREIFNPYNDYF